ncbi:very short patch repair endonuclease [Paracoccus indicus]|uniref:very short patch repair endonuclease n=1 Tax=Paracoccus indicus TaxID=2079229 RepID=UPI001FE53699|nr:very short patch repair endonuclease [Paracoccus indicus]
MADTLTPEKRSVLTSRIRSTNTKPEMIVRKTLHAMGFRYRVHAKELPGKPDIVMRPRKAAIFVHGCYWHVHDDPACKRAHAPKSNLGYWNTKLLRNRERD